jgi:hypothetical protein
MMKTLFKSLCLWSAIFAATKVSAQVPMSLTDSVAFPAGVTMKYIDVNTWELTSVENPNVTAIVSTQDVESSHDEMALSEVDQDSSTTGSDVEDIMVPIAASAPRPRVAGTIVGIVAGVLTSLATEYSCFKSWSEVQGKFTKSFVTDAREEHPDWSIMIGSSKCRVVQGCPGFQRVELKWCIFTRPYWVRYAPKGKKCWVKNEGKGGWSNWAYSGLWTRHEKEIWTGY